MVRVPPGLKGPAEGPRAGPLGSPAACLLAGAHDARRLRGAWRMALPGQRLRKLQAPAGLHPGHRRRFTARLAHEGQPCALCSLRAVTRDRPVQGGQPLPGGPGLPASYPTRVFVYQARLTTRAPQPKPSPQTFGSSRPHPACGGLGRGWLRVGRRIPWPAWQG